MENQKIADTQYTTHFLLDILAKYYARYAPFKEITSIEETLISKDRGFGSNIYRIELRSSEEVCYSVVCKFPTAQHLNDYLRKCNQESKKLSEKEVRAQEELNRTQVRETHNREVDFYRFAEEFVTKDLKIPTFIYGEHMTEDSEGLIIMSDLSSFTQNGPSRGLTKSEALKMVSTVCVLHAECHKHQELIESRFQPVKSLVNCIKGYVTLGVNDLLSKGYSWFNQHLADRIIALADYEELMKRMACSPELGMPPVICHGDLWPANVLWLHDTNGSRQFAALIDWQDCFVGSYANDLASIMAINMDYEVRKSCEKQVLQAYVDTMNGYRKMDGLDADLSYEKVYAAYKRALPVALLIMITVLGNSFEDVAKNGDDLGKITKRFMKLLEEVDLE